MFKGLGFSASAGSSDYYITLNSGNISVQSVLIRVEIGKRENDTSIQAIRLNPYVLLSTLLKDSLELHTIPR